MRNTFKSTYRGFNRRQATNLIDYDGIALLFVSRQSWKSATRNTVEALRYESLGKASGWGMEVATKLRQGC